MKGKITFLISFFLATSLFGQFKKTHTITKDTFPDGKLKETIEIHVKETKTFNLHTYVKSTKKVITRYYPNGKVHYILTYHNSIGTDEKECAELFFKQEEFWDNGNKKSFMKIECDCHLYVYKEWNRNEKLLNKTRSKIKRFY
jgi:antitoxin component YwqK of YwqJK toxin-antitoxin module